MHTRAFTVYFLVHTVHKVNRWFQLRAYPAQSGVKWDSLLSFLPSFLPSCLSVSLRRLSFSSLLCCFLPQTRILFPMPDGPRSMKRS